MRTFSALLVVAVLALGVALGVTAQEPISYAKQIQPVFLKECSDCHMGHKPKKGLALDQGKGYDSLVGKASNEVPEMQLVAPGDPASSYLWHKLEHTAKEGRGMPRTMFGSKKLSADDLALVKQWISEGAKP